MCLRYALWMRARDTVTDTELAVLTGEAAAAEEAPSEAEHRPRYNVALTQPMPVLGRGGLRVARFGVPGPQGRPVGNARDDQLERYWRGRPTERCLVPANGWYEWAADRQPWYLTHRERPALWFAGLAAEGGFAIVTTAANPDCAAVHDRMPAVLDLATAAAWLDPRTPSREASALAVPLRGGLVRRWKVSRDVGSVRRDEPRLIEPEAGLFGSGE